MIGSKHLPIRFDEIDGFVRISDGTRYMLLGSKRYDAIYNRIKYMISQKSGITYIFFSLLCKNQSWSWCLWFFVYRQNIDFAWCYNTH